MIACSVDDLPAPFGPIRPTISPGATSSESAADGRDRPVAHLEVARRRRPLTSAPRGRRSRRGTRRRRRGSPRISSGVPPASVRPWSSTWMRSQTSMISAMLWSIRSTPASWSSRTERTTAANSGTSASGSPAAGSSISTNVGSVASARATPSRRSSPCASAPAGSVGLSASRPITSRRSAARRRASRGEAPTPSAATSTFSRTESDRNARLCWNVRASPWRPRRLALQRVMSRPSSSTVPSVGEVEAAEQVDEGRLAGAVRPDQPDDLVAVQLERDALHGLHPVERAGQAGGPERSSGPPIVLRVWLCRPARRP